ncbi:MAG TPA: EAL domain-containing protein [Alphaproteobacteria bacterium]|nr:EAL domain-containing protein [Alphaproteobacteria bacterium]USO06051.1 MAG: EAL domain-containing protein [Rhodospirillales bacterium]HOO81359.1 EAL domain-containing protein [Alphaproteobacteria bacterium]
MTNPSETKKQRDRFLAFAFASADLFLEISMEGRITYALGASKSLTGFEDEDIIGKKMLELFSVYDQAQIQNIYENAQAGKRAGPLIVDLNELVSKRKAVFTAMRMPEDPNFYITLGFSNLLMSRLAGEISAISTGPILDRAGFIQQAKDTFDIARSIDQRIEITLFDFTPTKEQKERLGKEGWNSFTESIGHFLQSQAIDGQAATMISDGKYGLIHEKDIDSALIRERIESLAAKNDPEGEGVEVQSKTIHTNLNTLNNHDATRALVYTVNEFDREGTNFTIETLNSCAKDYVDANTERIKKLQSIIERQDFTLHFQPIVKLKTKEVSHYEILSRFKEGDTMEWIMLGEDTGLAPAFDMAVCERAINHIKHKGGGSRTVFSVNLSSQSIQDDTFKEKLMEKLGNQNNLHERLIFEVTESGHIKDRSKIQKFIEQLKSLKFTITLDDFGTNAATIQHLQKLPVDYVKISGKYIRKILSSGRDAATVKNLTKIGKEHNIKVIAEFVEEQAQADMLMEIGVDYGQGYLFGKPETAPSFTPPKK